jgi:hypothetical protein
MVLLQGQRLTQGRVGLRMCARANAEAAIVKPRLQKLERHTGAALDAAHCVSNSTHAVKWLQVMRQEAAVQHQAEHATFAGPHNHSYA